MTNAPKGVKALDENSRNGFSWPRMIPDWTEPGVRGGTIPDENGGLHKDIFHGK